VVWSWVVLQEMNAAATASVKTIFFIVKILKHFVKALNFDKVLVN